MARIVSQAVFFGLALWLFVRSLDPFDAPANPFLGWDPLIWLTHRRLEPALLLPPGTVLLLGLLLGRFFCGWLCPLGALIAIQDRVLAPLRALLPWGPDHPARGSTGRWRRALVLAPPSLLLLAASAVTAFFQPAILPWLHPNVWLLRIFSLSVPGLAFWAFLVLLSGLLSRAWCTYLCPLGALYGLLARVVPERWSAASRLRLRVVRCSECGRCDRCPMGAVPVAQARTKAGAPARRVLPHQCTLCFAFEASCPVHGFAFAAFGGMGSQPRVPYAGQQRLAVPAAPQDPLRRLFLKQTGLALGGLAAGAALGHLGVRQHLIPLLRPPGVVNEELFLQRCLRCHQCVRSCPNGIIKPAGLEAGVSGWLTPALAFGPRGCEYNCQVCQLVCPNGAIPRQSLRQKQITPIGLARIDKELCVVTKKGIPCLVCEEFCPIPEKAIRFEKRMVEAGGVRKPLQVPLVVDERCNGCGICQANCPADPLAIVVKKV